MYEDLQIICSKEYMKMRRPPCTNSSWASSGTEKPGTSCPQLPSVPPAGTVAAVEECLAKNVSIAVSNTRTMYLMLANDLELEQTKQY